MCFLHLSSSLFSPFLSHANKNCDDTRAVNPVPATSSAKLLLLFIFFPYPPGACRVSNRFLSCWAGRDLLPYLCVCQRASGLRATFSAAAGQLTSLRSPRRTSSFCAPPWRLKFPSQLFFFLHHYFLNWEVQPANKLWFECFIYDELKKKKTTERQEPAGVWFIFFGIAHQEFRLIKAFCWIYQGRSRGKCLLIRREERPQFQLGSSSSSWISRRAQKKRRRQQTDPVSHTCIFIHTLAALSNMREPKLAGQQSCCCCCWFHSLYSLIFVCDTIAWLASVESAPSRDSIVVSRKLSRIQ